MGVILKPSVPDYACDNVGAILEGILVELNKSTKHAMILDTKFALPTQILDGKILVLFEPDSSEFVLRALEMEVR